MSGHPRDEASQVGSVFHAIGTAHAKALRLAQAGVDHGGGVNCVSHICTYWCPQGSGGGCLACIKTDVSIQKHCGVRAMSSGASQCWI